MGAPTQTTRRALIGGAGLASVALIAPAIAAATTPVQVASSADWDRTFAVYERARLAADATEWALKESDAECEAWQVLMDTPAPHAAALHWKLDYLFGHPGKYSEGYCDSWKQEIVAVVIKDALRLAGGVA